MSTKKTVVLGASPNESRYANFACHMLHNAGFEFVPVGIKRGEILGLPILDLRTKPEVPGIHTVTLYIGQGNQSEWYDYIFSLNPKRIIFNPGAENSELKSMVEKRGMEAAEACTLVLIRTGQF